MSSLSFSRNLAICLGVVTPLLETIRRWSTWREEPAAFFDDFLIGGFLLFGAWLVGKNAITGQKCLTAAWGFMCGMIYPSFFGQLEAISKGDVDSAPISSEAVAVVKGIGFPLAVLGLATSLRPVPED